MFPIHSQPARMAGADRLFTGLFILSTPVSNGSWKDADPCGPGPETGRRPRLEV